MTFEKTLRTLCKIPTRDVFGLAETLHFSVDTRGTRRFAYRPGIRHDSPMVVCHADTVVNGGESGHEFRISKGKAYSIALDDRLGIACMFQAIQDQTPLGDCAMLICDDEEIGRSTASIFDYDVNPNWLVELDRRGTDAVMYEYETPLLQSLLRSVGFKIGSGSFSDICYLEHLEVVGFNVGVGYHHEHSNECFADLADTHAQIDKLHKFLAKFGDVRLDHESYSPRHQDYSQDRPYWQDWSSYEKVCDDRWLGDEEELCDF